jgi:hypothetical protein
LEEITIFVQFTDERYPSDSLRSLLNQHYDRHQLHLFLDISAFASAGSRTIQDFLEQHGHEYRSIHTDYDRSDTRQQSINYAIAHHTDYFLVDQNVILHPRTLKRLHDLNLDVVAPMLTYDGYYSNFHAYVDDNGYYRGGDNYTKIINRELKGIHNVPVVNGCCLIQHRRLKYVTYDDGSGRQAYVIFSDALRKQLIPQYIDNTCNHGIILNYQNKLDDEIASLDLHNNKQFFLDADRSSKKAVICDVDWLSPYLAIEHFYLVRILHDVYNFHIINCRRLDFDNLDILDDLNKYDVLLTAYHRYTRVPLALVSSHKIYKMDDLVNDDYYTGIARYNMKHSEMVISPYAYVLRKYYDHDNVVWVPYSSALEGCDGYPRIGFNRVPKNKVLISGGVNSAYPFRQYVSALESADLEKLAHPGYQPHSDDSEAAIRTKYFERLSEYLCCFTDAPADRYIVLKNFEIASVGALLLTDKAIEAEMTALGFIDYETCIFCDQETFLEKVAWILDSKNRSEVDKIRRAGMQLAREHHMTRHRAAQIHELARSMVERTTPESAQELPSSCRGPVRDGLE